MKTSTLILLSAANVAYAAKFVNGPEGWAQAIKLPVTEQDFSVPKIKNRAALPPKLQELKNRNPHIPGAKTVKIRYGPYTVPGARKPGGEGMIENRPSPSVDKPCKNCMILGMNAGLEYPDGKDANTNTLMWLHHMVMFNIGKGASDATCTTFGAPHLIVGSMPQSSERIFSSGNERTTTWFNPPWSNMTNLGYPLYPADRFGLIVDLMNMNMEAKQAYLTIYFDFIEGHPQHMEEVKPVWLDAFQCGTSEIPGRAPGAKFDFASSPWIANFDGDVMGAGGHLHDGGTKLDIIVDKKVICTSTPTYGTDEQAMARAELAKNGDNGDRAKVAPKGVKFIAARQAPKGGAPKGNQGGGGGGGGGGGHNHAGGQHIIAMSICADNQANYKSIPISPLEIKRVKKGQSWTLRAYYDYQKHAGMKKNGGNTMSTVMGISIMYAKTDKKRQA